MGLKLNWDKHSDSIGHFKESHLYGEKEYESEFQHERKRIAVYALRQIKEGSEALEFLGIFEGDTIVYQGQEIILINPDNDKESFLVTEMIECETLEKLQDYGDSEYVITTPELEEELKSGVDYYLTSNEYYVFE